MVQMIDCSTRLTASNAATLKSNGITHVGRYLSKNSKGITATEAAIIKAAGLNIVSVYENGSTNVSHFTAANASADLLDAYNQAKAIGQPEVAGNAIYFTVDFDAQPTDMPAILAYFQAIKKQLTSYKVGAYGNYAVLNYLKAHNAADYYWQTYAWSSGQQCDFTNIYQYKNDTTLTGVSFAVDYDDLVTDDVGAWGQPKQNQEVNSVLGTVTVTVHTVLRDGPSGSANIIRSLDPKDSTHVFKCYGTDSNWFNIGAGFVHCSCASFQPA